MVWLSVGPALLSQLPEAAMILDEGARVHAANAPMCRLLNVAPSELTTKTLAEICRDPGPVLSAIGDARSDGQTTVECTFDISDRPLRVSMELRADRGNGTSALLCVVLSWHVEATSGPSSAVLADVSYEISCVARDFGIIRQAWSRVSALSPDALVGRLCFEAIGGVGEPCSGCPARVLSDNPAAGRRIGVVPSSRNDGVCRVVAAERVDDITVRLESFVAGAEVITAMVQARIDQLCASAGISLREREVLNLLILGRSISEAARALEISPRTVKFHQARIFKKLGAESRFDLMRLIA